MQTRYDGFEFFVCVEPRSCHCAITTYRRDLLERRYLTGTKHAGTLRPCSWCNVHKNDISAIKRYARWYVTTTSDADQKQQKLFGKFKTQQSSGQKIKSYENWAQSQMELKEYYLNL